MPREGILVHKPYERITGEQVQQIHQASLQILVDPGLICFSKQAAEVFRANGAGVKADSAADNPRWQIKIPEKLVKEALDSAPKTIKLGARNPDNALIMKGDEPRVYFITGSETNIWLDVDFPSYVKKSDRTTEIKVPEFHPRRGTVADLCQVLADMRRLAEVSHSAASGSKLRHLNLNTLIRLLDIGGEIDIQPDIGLRAGDKIDPGLVAFHYQGIIRVAGAQIDRLGGAIEGLQNQFFRYLDLPGGAIAGRNGVNFSAMTTEYFRRLFTKEDQAGVDQYPQGSPVNLLDLLIGYSLIGIGN